MAKSIRSKVKKRLRTVKRGVVKEQLLDPTSKIGKRTTQIAAKLAEAATGFLQPGVQPCGEAVGRWGLGTGRLAERR